MGNNEMQHKRFEDLFRKNYSRLYYYALDWVNDEDAAKDLVSELFGDIWLHWSSWNPEHEEAYLSRALRNRCLNYLKRQSVEQNILQAYVMEREALIDNDIALHEERMKQVETVMDSLSPKTRFILEQCYLEGKKYSELAALMDTTSGMIHKHISKALALFRKALGVNFRKGGVPKAG